MMQLTGYGFIRVQLWSGATLDFSAVTSTVAVQHVTQATDIPVVVHDQTGATIPFIVVILRMVSGEIVHVRSTKEVRTAFNMGSEPAYLDSERKPLHMGAVQ